MYRRRQIRKVGHIVVGFLRKIICTACGAVLFHIPVLGETETIGNYTWRHEPINDMMTEIVAVSPNPAGQLTIPTTFIVYGGWGESYADVTGIRAGVFAGCTDLTSVVIPSATYYNIIDTGAFSDCSNLVSVSIGAYAHVSSGAFSTCKKLKMVTLSPYSTIMGGAFPGCDSLMAFSLLAPNAGDPSGYTVGNGLLLSDQGRQLVCGINGDVTIPDSVSIINDSAFSGCGGLTSIQMPANLYTIGDYAFSGCGSLSCVSIPDSVRLIGDYAFSGCTLLCELQIGANVADIGTYAFKDCAAIRSLSIPSSVTNIERCAFAGCKLSTVSVHQSNPVYVALNGLLLTKDAKTLVHGLNSETSIPAGVVSISDSAYQECRYLENLDLPEGVTNIGSQAFRKCVNLKNIAIPNTVKRIGWAAFDGCSSLTNIIIPDGVVCIETSTFSGCEGLTEITIPDSVRCIDDIAFADCSGLVNLIIPSGVTNIGYQAFRNCNKLSTVYLPRSLENMIHESVFQWCPSDLEIIYYDGEHPPTLTYTYSLFDGEATVTGASNITSILEIPSYIDGYPVVGIGNMAFHDCDELVSVTIPDSVRVINNFAFQQCKNLSTVVIGNGVTNIGVCVFMNCDALSDIKVCADNAYYLSVNGLLLSKNGRALVHGINGNVVIPSGVTCINSGAFYGCSGLVSVAMPDSVTSIGAEAYNRCSNLKNVEIPCGVTNIGRSAFESCRALASITIPAGVRKIEDDSFRGCIGITNVIIESGTLTIGDRAFSNCKCLTNVTMPDSMTSIGAEAYNGCSNLKSVEIPCGVTNIGRSAFESCSALTSITIPAGVRKIEDNAFWCCGLTNMVIESGVICIGRYAFYGCGRLTNVTIPDSVASIGAEAFEWCNGLTSVTIGNGVESIGRHAFSVCTRLTNMSIGNAVKDIGDYAFSNCSGLTSVTIPESVTNISCYAFYDCSGLTNVTIGAGSKLIGDYSFYNCCNLINATILDGETCIGRSAFGSCGCLTSVIIGNGVNSIGPCAFAECGSLTNMAIPNTVTNIGPYAFGGCSSLTNITIPNGVKSIKDMTFWACAGLMHVSIPSSVTNIGYDAFAYCSGLTNVTIPASVTGIGTTAFFHSGLMSVAILGHVLDIADDVFSGCNELQYVYLSRDYDGLTSMIPPNVDIIRFKSQQVVSFDVAGGSLTPKSIIVDYGSLYGELPIPVRTGYTFIGWECGNMLLDYEAVVAAVDDHTLVAKWQINQYSVTFDANGGTGGWSSNQNYGATIYVPLVLREGYTFAGWSTEPPDSVPDGDVYCSAQWLINKYRVTFDAAGGDGGWTQELDYGSHIVAPTPRRAEYSFDGWLPSPDATVPDHDVTYVAQWKVWDITVSLANSRINELYPNDYQRITNIVIGASVASLPDNFFEGCDALERLTFLSPDTELGNNDLRKVGKLFANQPDGYWVVQGVLLGYKGTCPREIPGLGGVKRVIGDALEGCTALEELNFTAESVLTTIGTNAFKRCTELQQMTLPPSLEEIGSEAFMGCSYLGNVIVPGSVRKIGDRAFKNCTGFTAAQIEYGVESLGAESFYGDWRISEVDIPSTVTNIGVNAFGGDSSIIRIGLRGDVRRASEIFSNYKFIREATVKEGDGEVVDGLFQGFEKLRDVRFFGNCPALANEGQLLYAMTPNNTATDPGLTTYVSKNSTGWDGTLGSHSLPQAWPLVGGSRRSIAYWDIPTYLCQFDSNGGTLGVQDTYQYSEKPFTLPPEPVQSGYKFAGWWTKPVGGLHVTDDTIFIEGVYTMLYAHWIKGHWVFLDPNGGTVVNDFVTYVEETTYGVLPLAVRSGYAFNGWLYNDVKIEPTTVISDKSDHTLIAQWIANLYSVHYNANGGIGSMENESCVYGVETALRKNIFTNEGFVFSGWATNETGDVVFADCETVSNLTAVANGWVELYAVWEESDVNPDPSNLNFYFTGDANWERCSEGVVVEKDGDILRYDSVWKSGMVTNNQKSVLAADVYGAGKIGFWWKVSCESFRDWKLDNLEFAVDGVPQEPWINGETDWQYVEFEIDASGSHTLTWTYSKDDSDEELDVGEDCGRVTAAVWTPALKTLDDYVNCPKLDFYSEGDAEWHGTRAESHDGIASLRSGVIDHNGTTTLKVDVFGEGRIGFWWKVSSESLRKRKLDYVLFAIDGDEQCWIGGDVDWTNVAFNVVGTGIHTLSWSYKKDVEGSVGGDCAWLDEVVWMPNSGTPPELTSEEVGRWISGDLATRFAKSGESAEEYEIRFAEKFGSDPVAALSMPTDKKDAQGNEMYVWQDYVAGTDPTDTNSVFTAKVEIVDGTPVVTWEPKLSDGEEALRNYTIYGKTNLTDKAWHSPTNEASRFFKVEVDMK